MSVDVHDPEDGPVPAPSDEAVEAAMDGFKANYTTYDGHCRDALTAAYAIDMPRREAEARAEERAATLRLREAARKLIGAYMADEDLAPYINALEATAGFMQQGQGAHFNPEAE